MTGSLFYIENQCQIHILSQLNRSVKTCLDSEIKFTHGDLHQSNVLITRSEPFHVLAIVDWEQSGWLPVYWEARKAQYTADRNDEWSKKYLPMILCQYTSTWDPWDYYTTAMGC